MCYNIVARINYALSIESKLRIAADRENYEIYNVLHLIQLRAPFFIRSTHFLAGTSQGEHRRIFPLQYENVKIHLYRWYQKKKVQKKREKTMREYLFKYITYVNVSSQ